MRSFEEEFPNLKDLTRQYWWGELHTLAECQLLADNKQQATKEFKGKYLRVDDVKEHCLDKQRVREVIEKFLPCLNNFPCPDSHQNYCENCTKKDYIKLELGL